MSTAASKVTVARDCVADGVGVVGAGGGGQGYAGHRGGDDGVHQYPSKGISCMGQIGGGAARRDRAAVQRQPVLGDPDPVRVLVARHHLVVELQRLCAAAARVIRPRRSIGTDHQRQLRCAGHRHRHAEHYVQRDRVTEVVGAGCRDPDYREDGRRLRLRRGRPEEQQARDEDGGGGAAWTGGPTGPGSIPRPGGRGGAKAITPARGGTAEDSRANTLAGCQACCRVIHNVPPAVPIRPAGHRGYCWRALLCSASP